MLSDSWESAFKIASEDPQKILLKNTKHMKLSGFRGNFRGLNYPSYQLFWGHFLIVSFFYALTFFWSQDNPWSKNMQKLGLNL